MTGQERQLRDYQLEAVESVEAEWAKGNRTSVVIPTGGGKSTVIAALAARAYQRGERVVMLAHRAELLTQMATAVAQVDHSIPMYDIGIVRGTDNDCEAGIIAATLQTLANSSRLQAVLPRHVTLVDECHHAGASSYHDVLNNLGAFDGFSKLCGFTATMHRDGNSGVALADVFTTIAFERDLGWAIDEGFLVEPYGVVAHTDALDALDNLRLVAGDYGPKQLAAVMEASETIRFVAAAIHEYARNRRMVVFAASVKQAEMLCRTLEAIGIAAQWVNGSMPYKKRLPIYEAFRTGTIQALINVGILTEGADFPMCDAVVLARPTRSMNLYTQMVGRAIRLHPGKTDALVLDISGRGDGVVTLNDLRDGVEIKHVGDRKAFDDGELVDPAERAPREKVEREEFTLQITPGGMTARDFHLLPDRAAKRYRQTEGGVLFVDTQQERRAVVLAREGNLWRVGTANTRTGEFNLSSVRMSFEEADKVASIAAGQLGGVRNKPRSSEEPSEKQLAFAAGLGIDTDGMNRGKLSDAITTRLVSRVVDGQLPTRIEEPPAPAPEVEPAGRINWTVEWAS
ncbi:DNA helicase [Mycobacterium phage Collard]|uniref:DNA helicase n=1 Tax=Mycobacterium phage Collard TaxID=2301704 RepID=A0A385DUU4_9CAUD|nr:DNA helicase [Mycobacterium phage Collard]AXQ63236.1 DNA helicase [Mycobacterium phage Collard]UEM46456.1 DNA helicase [Mycobacterium phage InvictusManeo]